MAFDEGAVYYAYQGGEDDVLNEKELIVDSFKKFIKEYFGQDGDRNHFPYREELVKQKTFLRVDLFHVKQQQPELGLRLQEDPADLLPLFERAAREVLRDDHHKTAEGEDWTPPQVQVLLYSSRAIGPASLRQLNSKCVSQLVQIPGIITAASRPKHKASQLVVQCKYCHALERLNVRPGLAGVNIPNRCNTYDGSVQGQPRCKPNSYVVVGERSTWADQQQLKLQERPEDIPTGELPRTLTLIADRTLVNRVTPGTRVRVTGIYSVTRGQQFAKGAPVGSAMLQQPYLRLVDIREESEGHKADDFSAEEVAQFTSLARQEGILSRIQASIAPKIFGAEDIKKAVACLLFGGCRKIMPDGTARRGDVNVLLLGDPSTAKSQFLKFVDKVAPICVYTSGKGSSAAGLTAAVVQDANSREFFLEGGAMVLADGGVVCIDEFDKMRPEDRVAIHEAMEQQTISIAKAGITTVLKSRTSVLAAANPPSGRYDDYQSTADNIDLQSTILSRFDLIFVVRDLADTANDQRIADFVLGTHREAVGASAADGGSSSAAAGSNGDLLDDAMLKRYIHYARSKCFPRLNAGAARKLQQKYVEIREKAREAAAADDEGVPPVPIGVRQLEALVRISESFARMTLCREATEAHVDLAMDLFNKSTMNAMEAGISEPSTLQRQATADAEAQVREHIPLNGNLSFQRLMERLQTRGFSSQQAAAAIKVMVGKGELRRRAEGKLLQRVR